MNNPTHHLEELIRSEINNQQKMRGEISPASRLKEDLGLASMKLIAIVTAIANRLGLSLLDFSGDELMSINTVHDIITLFSAKSSTDASQ